MYKTLTKILSSFVILILPISGVFSCKYNEKDRSETSEQLTLENDEKNLFFKKTNCGTLADFGNFCLKREGGGALECSLH